ncbi:MAG: hypothetical protein LBS01_11535 [Prevotellaceae bacterium]|jgi:hypothetical protein|nr:hypothetical protein [Prevotellaceae bacterium]
MQKILTSLGVLFVAAMLFASCEGPMGPAGKDSSKMILDYKIPKSAWQPVYDNNNLFLYYQCFIKEPELTSEIYNNGGMVAYLEVNEGGVMVQKMLPYIIVGEDNLGTYSWYIDCDYTVGEIGFYIKNSVFLEELPYMSSGTMNFRVIYLW